MEETHARTSTDNLTVTFSPMDLLFYGSALYAGYKYSVRRITPEELQLLVKEKS